MEVFSDLCFPPFPPSAPFHPETPTPWVVSGEESGCSGLGGASQSLAKEFWAKESQLSPARGLIEIWVRNSSPPSSIQLY